MTTITIMKTELQQYNKISIAKGIGILLMVVGHPGCPSMMRDFIYMFHMPLFFLISGYCFKDKYLFDFKLFAKKRISGLYIPFVKYCLLFLLLHNVFYEVGLFNSEYGTGIASIKYDLKTFAVHLVQIPFLINYEQLISPLWFVAALFVGYFIFYSVKRLVRNDFFVSVILVVLTMLLLPAAKSGHPIVFRSAYAALFLMGGVFLCRLSTFRAFSKWWFSILCLIMVGIGAKYFATEMPKVDYGTIIPFTICSVVGTIMVLNISDSLSQKCDIISRLLGFIGNHTMSILIWHFLCFKIVTLFILILRGDTLLKVAKFPTITDNTPNSYWIFYVVIGITVPLLIDLIIEKIKRLYY